MLDKKMVGQIVQNRRKEKQLTQSEVAELTGLSRNYLSDIENGRYMPSAETLFRLTTPSYGLKRRE